MKLLLPLIVTGTVVVLFFQSCGQKYDDIPPHVRALEQVTIFPKDTEPSGSVQLSKETVFSDSLLLNRITAVVADDSGYVYQAGEAWNRRELHRFDPEGNRIDSLGTFGKAMGGFLQIDNIQLRDTLIYLFDGELGRTTLFSPKNSRFTDTLNLSPVNAQDLEELKDAVSIPFWKKGDGSYLIRFKDNRNPAYYPDRSVRYYSVNQEGVINSEQLLEQRDTRYLVGDYAGRPAPFTLSMPERSLMTVNENDELFSVWTSEFLIKVYASDGSYLRAYYHPFERSELNREEVIHPRFSHNDQLLRIRESAEYPEKWPAVYSILTDDEKRIWISAITGNNGKLEWWVLDELSGSLLARFNWPKESSFRYIKNGYVYTTEKDRYGFEEVVRYRMEWEM